MAEKKLVWRTEKRKISDLVEFEHNPRRLTHEQEKKLTESIERFGLVEIPAIDVDETILAGHQRLKVYQKVNGDAEIDVRVPNRALTKKEREEYIVRSNKNTGEWDFDLLKEHFEADDLFAWGFEEGEIVFDMEQKAEVEKSEKPLVEFSEELREEHNYIVLYFKEDYSWLQALTLLSDELTTKKALHSKENFEAKGLGRVLNGEEVMTKFFEAGDGK